MTDREKALKDTLDCLRPLGYGLGTVAVLLMLAMAPMLAERGQSWMKGIMDFSWVPDAVKQFASSTIFGTLVTAAFGAFAGAYAANRVQTKRSVIAELNSVSAAIVLCFAICNRIVALKKQHVRPMQERYEIARKAFLQSQQAARGATTPQTIVFQADFQTLTPLKLPTEALERSIFEKISIRGRALAAAVELVGAIDALEKTITYRNELIVDTRKNQPASQLALAQMYFGIPSAGELTDERVAGNITAISVYTDDCIFFAGILADHLREYGNALRKQNAWKFRLHIGKFRAADWSTAEKEGLIPQREQYGAWLKGFVTTPTRWKRLKDWLRSLLFGAAK